MGSMLLERLLLALNGSALLLEFCNSVSRVDCLTRLSCDVEFRWGKHAGDVAPWCNVFYTGTGASIEGWLIDGLCHLKYSVLLQYFQRLFSSNLAFINVDISSVPWAESRAEMCEVMSDTAACKSRTMVFKWFCWCVVLAWFICDMKWNAVWKSCSFV